MKKLGQKQSGFTLIELIVVIVILGILSVTAIPRYLDITEEAHIAMTEGVAGAFRSGVLLANADYLVKHNNGEAPELYRVEARNGGTIIVGANDKGYPVYSDGSSVSLSTSTQCRDLWEGLLKTNLIAGTGGLSPFSSAPDVIATIDGDSGSPEGGEGVDGVSVANIGVCNYLMSNGGVDMLLQYNSNNGRVDLTRLN